jgi:hypothetical protein
VAQLQICFERRSNPASLPGGNLWLLLNLAEDRQSIAVLVQSIVAADFSLPPAGSEPILAATCSILEQAPSRFGISGRIPWQAIE